MNDQTWTLVELLWTAAHAIGLIVNVRLLKRALEKRRGALVRPPSANRDARILAADRYIRNDGSRLLFFGMGAVVGVWALLILDPTPLFRAVSEGALIVMGVTLLAASVTDLLDEPQMAHLLEKDDQERRAAALLEGTITVDPTGLLRELQQRRRARIAERASREP